jgi:SAM-dependent methyltransferase
MKDRNTALLIEWLKQRARATRSLVYSVLEPGEERWCPICGRSSRRFFPAGDPPRADAKCIHCNSLERHRYVWRYFEKMTNIFDGKPKRMLHVAPESFFVPRLKKQLGDGYLTADLLDPRAMVVMDVTDIQFPNNTFDIIYCSHVLEHVPDDKKALREFYRTLKDGGWSLILVPITAEQTLEDDAIVDPQERLRVYGQEDHVRRYGPDFEERLREAGFCVTALTVSGWFEEAEIVRMGLGRAPGAIYYCTK